MVGDAVARWHLACCLPYWNGSPWKPAPGLECGFQGGFNPPDVESDGAWARSAASHSRYPVVQA